MAQPFSFTKFETEYERYSAPRQAKSSFLSLRNAWNRGNMEEVRRHAIALEPKMKDTKREMPSILIRQLSFLKTCKEKPKIKKTTGSTSNTSGASDKDLAVSGSGFESPTAAVKLPPLKSSDAAATTAKPKDEKLASPRKVRGTMKELEDKIMLLEKWIHSVHENLQSDTIESVEASGPKPLKGKPIDPIYEELNAIVEHLKQKKMQTSEDSKRLRKDIKTKDEHINLLEKKMKKLDEDIKSEKFEDEEHIPKTNKRQKNSGQTDRDGGTSPDVVASIRKTLQSQKAAHSEAVKGIHTELKTKTDRLKDLENALNQFSEDIKTDQYKKEEPKTKDKKKLQQPQQQNNQVKGKKSPDFENGSVRQVMQEVKKHLRQRDVQYAAEIEKLKEETRYAKERLAAEAGTRDIKTKQFGKQLQDDNKSLQRSLSEREMQVETMQKAIEELHKSLQVDGAKDVSSASRGKQTTVKTQAEAHALKLKDVQQFMSDLQEKFVKAVSSLKKREEELENLRSLTDDIHSKIKSTTQESKASDKRKGDQTSRTPGDKDFQRMLNEIKVHLDTGQEKPGLVKEKTFDVDSPPDKEREMINLKATIAELREKEKDNENTIKKLNEDKSSLEEKVKTLQDAKEQTTNDSKGNTPRAEARVPETETKLSQTQEEKEALSKRTLPETKHVQEV